MRYEGQARGAAAHPDCQTDALARGLGVFSFALGLYELLAARSLTRALGMRGNETLVRAYGVPRDRDRQSASSPQGPDTLDLGPCRGGWARPRDPLHRT
jgi:hypothetical protein